MKTSKICRIEHSDIINWAKDLHNWANNDPELDGPKRMCLNKSCIITVPRGGLVCAGYAAHALGIRDVYTININQRYTDNNTGDSDAPSEINTNPDNIINLLHDKNYKGIVFIDDILDSGVTYQFIKKIWLRLHACETFYVFTLAMKDQLYSDDTYINNNRRFSIKIDKNDWVIFPWEEIKL